MRLPTLMHTAPLPTVPGVEGMAGSSGCCLTVPTCSDSHSGSDWAHSMGKIQDSLGSAVTLVTSGIEEVLC